MADKLLKDLLRRATEIREAELLAEDQALREKCVWMAIDAHKKMNLGEETVRETAHRIFSFIKEGLVHDEL
jgi:hypothetical protein